MTKEVVNIVIVDKNANHRENLRSHLRVHDHGNIDFALGGFHLLSLLENSEYHLIIIGSDMEDMSALEMVSLVRTKYDDEQLPIVYLYSSKSEDMDNIIEMGLHGVIMCVTSDNFILQIQNKIEEIRDS